MPAPFRIGLAGAGRMGGNHLRALAGSDRVAIAAIAEPVAQARSRLAGGGPAGAGAVVYASLGEMLDRAVLDAVLIAAPSDQHLQIVGEVAARGLPILCEKPCGTSSGQARAAAAVAAAAGVPLQVAYWRRFFPALRQLRDRMAAGDLGTIHLVTCYQWDERPPPAAFRAHSGGIAIDMGVHEFDQLRWLTGQDIHGVTGTASPLTDADVRGRAADPGPAAGADADPDSAQLIAAMSAGTLGFVSLGRYHPAGDMARAEVFGTRGTVRCDFLDPADGERAQLDALRRQAEGFADYAAGAGQHGASAEDAAAALEAAELATEQLKPGTS
jgi:myo-inositol 2-dehydrogenase/D-chiro-inositol 1-dehydrogenase